jgi:2-phosphosulfolactate phosphatase
VVVVIDVLRTCTLASILFDRGLRTLYLSPSIRRARRLAEEQELLLLGERDGLPPEGFNYGTSPAEIGHAEVAGRSAVLISEHGPQALARTEGAGHVLLGSLYNADAVVARAAASAEHEVALVCTGYGGDEDLDDTLCAGYLAAQLKRRFPDASLDGAALFAIGLLKAFPAPVGALWGSRAGQHLRRLDLTDDIAVGSLVSQTEKVPHFVERGENGLYRFSAQV